MFKFRLERVGDFLVRLCVSLSAMCLLGIMCLTVVEVIGRYGFNSPVFGRQDVAQALLACSIFLTFPVVAIRGEQICVDLLDHFFTPRFAFYRDVLIGLIISGTLITMGYWLFLRAEKIMTRGITSELLFIPKFPLVYFISGIVFVTGIWMGVRSLTVAFEYLWSSKDVSR